MDSIQFSREYPEGSKASIPNDPSVPEIIAKRNLKKFNLLPIDYNGTNGRIELPEDYSDPGLIKELEVINNLPHKFDPNSFDHPAPRPPDVQRTCQIASMCESGDIAFRQGDFEGAINHFTQGIAHAQDRPRGNWQNPLVLTNHLQLLYNGRAQAYLWAGQLPEALADADASIAFNPTDNPRAYMWKASCLQRMERFVEAKEGLLRAFEFGPQHSTDSEMQRLLYILIKSIERNETGEDLETM